jgi:DNA-directed RNA polymerase specialized sigma24 family protein
MTEDEATAEESRAMRDAILALPEDQQKLVQVALLKGATFEEAMAAATGGV